jgi:tRNA(Ile)-lysidine synthase
MLDVQRSALDVYRVKPQQRRVLIQSERSLRDFPPSNRYLIGVSGGRDSIALLSLLVDFGYKKLVICHLNHQLRGASSRGDARFVEKVARNLRLNCEIGSTDVGALAKRSKLSIETAARFARLAFFVEVARRRHCSRIFLAHHADDLVETALLNLFRGASPGGMAAMRKISVYRIGKTKLTILRPLLGVWRSEIDSYIKQQGLKFCEDKTNREMSSSRNRIRHRILPYINKTFGRDVSKAIWRTAAIWVDEESFLDAVTPLVESRLNVVELRKLAVPLQRRAIVDWFRLNRVPNAGFDLVEKVRSLMEPSSLLSKINVPGDRHIRRRAKTILIEG